MPGPSSTPLPGPSERVRQLAEKVYASAQSVRIMEDGVAAAVAHLRQTDDLGSFPPSNMEPRALVAHELAAGAVNYCYWFAQASIRPQDASSTRMYEILSEAWTEHKEDGYEAVFRAFASAMAQNQFPLAEARTRHLMQLLQPLTGGTLAEFISETLAQGDADAMVESLVRAYPGYADDPFLKRALLFVMQLKRMAPDLFPEVDGIPIPADYQVPKMLRGLRVLEYAPPLAEAVDGGRHLSSGSPEEAEIRAATIVAADQIAVGAGLRPLDVDTWLWLARKQVTAPFHLTVTTHY